MVSTQAVMKLFSILGINLYEHDPDTTMAMVVTPDGGVTKRVVDMSGYGSLGIVAMVSRLTGNGITKLEIVASESENMASPEVIKDSGTVAADSIGDQVALECSAEEIAHIGDAVGKHLRYAAGRVTMHHAADEAVVAYIAGSPRFAKKDLTPPTTII